MLAQKQCAPRIPTTIGWVVTRCMGIVCESVGTPVDVRKWLRERFGVGREDDTEVLTNPLWGCLDGHHCEALFPCRDRSLFGIVRTDGAHTALVMCVDR